MCESNDNKIYFIKWCDVFIENAEKQRKRIYHLERNFRYKNIEIAKKSDELKPFKNRLKKCSSNYAKSYDLIKDIKISIEKIKEEIYCDNEFTL